MRYFFTLFFLLVFNTGCKQKVISGTELENKLKETMIEYLQKTLQPGTIITINDMSYFPEKEKKIYVCNFQVKMRIQDKDTTGIMIANISNDFSKVNRTQ